MRLGLRLTIGFGLVLLAMGALAALGWEADRRLTQHRTALDTVAGIRIQAEELGALSGRWLPGGTPTAEFLEREAEQVAKALRELRGDDVRQDEALRFRTAITAVEGFHNGVLDVVTASTAVQRAGAELEEASSALALVLDNLLGETRDGAYLHPDGYASSEHVKSRLAEWRNVLSARMQLNTAVVQTASWQRDVLTSGGETPDLVALDAIRSALGNLVVSLADIEGRMTDATGKEEIKKAVSDAQRYLDALSGIEEAARGLAGARVRLRTSPEDMQLPLTAIEERNLAAVDKIRDLVMLVGAGLLAFAVFVALVTIVSCSARLRKGTRNAVRVLLALAEGKLAVPSLKAEKADVGGVVAAATQVALAESDIAEKMHAVADGRQDVTITLRSAEDSLGRAAQRLTADMLLLSRWIESLASGRFVEPQGGQTGAGGNALSQQVADLYTMLRTHFIELRSSVSALTKKMKSVDAACGKVNAALGENAAVDSGVYLQMADALETLAERESKVPEPDAAPVTSAASGARARFDMTEVEPLVTDVENGVRELAAGVSFLEDVARQVDTLAINVSIEAARAGEEGRGMEAIVTELRGVMERCREQGVHVSEIGHVTGKRIGKLERQLLDGVALAGVPAEAEPSPSASSATLDAEVVGVLLQSASVLRGVAETVESLNERVQGASIGMLGVNQHMESLRECVKKVQSVPVRLVGGEAAKEENVGEAKTQGERREKSGDSRSTTSSGPMSDMEPLTFKDGQDS